MVWVRPAAGRGELPLLPFFFDCIQRHGSLLIDSPAHERFSALADVGPAHALIPRVRAVDADDIACVRALFHRQIAYSPGEAE
jgi:DNA ligase 1